GTGAQRLAQILLEPARIQPALLLLRLLDLERDLETRAEHGLRAQRVLESRQRKRSRVEIFGVGPEADGRARRVLGDFADDFELSLSLAVRKAHVVFLAVAADPHLELFRQRVDDGDADAV